MPADPVRGRRWADHRRTLEAIAWKYRTCSPWRDLPDELGSFQTAHKRLIRWAVDGTWERILAAVQAAAEGADDIGWTVSVDSTVCRAHQHAAGARKRGSRPDRTRRPCAWTLPRRPEHEGPPRQRQPCTPPRPLRHRRPSWRRPGLRDRHGRHPCSAKTEDPTRCRPGGPRVLIPRDPKTPPPTWNPRCHPPAVRPTRPPSAARPRRRSPTGFRRRGVSATQRGRAMHQPAEAVARPGHANGQARHRLQGRTPPRRHPHLGTPMTTEQEPRPVPAGGEGVAGARPGWNRRGGRSLHGGPQP